MKYKRDRSFHLISSICLAGVGETNLKQYACHDLNDQQNNLMTEIIVLVI